MNDIKLATRLFLVLTVLTGILYPLVVTGIAQAVFSYQANGSIVKREGKAIGSDLIGQSFNDLSYFWCRPSMTPQTPYNAAMSSGSNLGPTNKALKDNVIKRIEALRAADPENTAPIPTDLVTASASGLDPDISVEAALYQVNRVSRSRGATKKDIERLIAKHTLGRQLGILGEARVRVLGLNIDLDRQFPLKQ
jgi:K+-transporting ATPase ATPase C chain